jgi:hypothetical protein
VRRGSQVALLASGLLLAACGRSCGDPSGGPEVADAGAQPISFVSADLGVRAELPALWSAAPPGPAASAGSLLLDARRLPDPGRTWLVAPRLAITAEEAVASTAEECVLRAKAELESLGSQPGVRLLRSERRARPLSRSPEAAELEVVFGIEGGGDEAPRELRQRALVLETRRRDGTRVTVSVNASWMSVDSAAVEAEVERIFSSVTAFEPTGADAGPSPAAPEREGEATRD